MAIATKGFGVARSGCLAKGIRKIRAVNEVLPNVGLLAFVVPSGCEEQGVAKGVIVAQFQFISDSQSLGFDGTDMFGEELVFFVFLLRRGLQADEGLDVISFFVDLQRLDESDAVGIPAQGVKELSGRRVLVIEIEFFGDG